MAVAARYLGQPIRDFYLDYRVLCEANLALHRDFSVDVLNTMSDPYRETADWGAEIEFPEDGLPKSKVPLLQSLSDIRELESPDPTTGRRMSDRVNAVRYYREQAGGVVPIMGWVEGALAEAADLRGLSSLLVDLYDEPEAVEEVLERCTADRDRVRSRSDRGGRRHHRAGRFCGFTDLAQDVPAVCSAIRAAHLLGSASDGCAYDGCTSAAISASCFRMWRKVAPTSWMSTGWSISEQPARSARPALSAATSIPSR